MSQRDSSDGYIPPSHTAQWRPQDASAVWYLPLRGAERQEEYGFHGRETESLVSDAPSFCLSLPSAHREPGTERQRHAGRTPRGRFLCCLFWWFLASHPPLHMAFRCGERASLFRHAALAPSRPKKNGKLKLCLRFGLWWSQIPAATTSPPDTAECTPEKETWRLQSSGFLVDAACANSNSDVPSTWAPR